MFLLAYVGASSALAQSDWSQFEASGLRPWIEAQPDIYAEGDTTRRMDINQANAGDLLSIGLLPSEVGAVLVHRVRFGDFTSLDELAAVEGLPYEQQLKIRPRLFVAIAPGGGSIATTQVFAGVDWRSAGTSAGLRAYLVGRHGQPGGIQARVALENDGGEYRQLREASRLPVDFISGSVEVPIGKSAKVLLGDYDLVLGQGLLAMGMARATYSSDPLEGFLQTGAFAHSGLSEGGFQRGVALQGKGRRWGGMAYASRRDMLLSASPTLLKATEERFAPLPNRLAEVLAGTQMFGGHVQRHGTYGQHRLGGAVERLQNDTANVARGWANVNGDGAWRNQYAAYDLLVRPGSVAVVAKWAVQVGATQTLFASVGVRRMQAATLHGWWADGPNAAGSNNEAQLSYRYLAATRTLLVSIRQSHDVLTAMPRTHLVVIATQSMSGLGQLRFSSSVNEATQVGLPEVVGVSTTRGWRARLGLHAASADTLQGHRGLWVELSESGADYPAIVAQATGKQELTKAFAISGTAALFDAPAGIHSALLPHVAYQPIVMRLVGQGGMLSLAGQVRLPHLVLSVRPTALWASLKPPTFHMGMSVQSTF